MTSKKELLLSLADRVEKEKPSLEPYHAIAALLGWENLNPTNATDDPHKGIRWRNPTGAKCYGFGPPDWLGSIDAAVSLMPEDWRITQMHQAPNKASFYIEVRGVIAVTKLCFGRAPTEPQARTAAALRALAAMEAGR